MRPPDLPPIEHYPHGIRARYVAGCRCIECRAANKRAYHELQKKAIAAAREVTAPDTPVGQVWTAPDGTKKIRQYRRACPGVHGAPCAQHRHLRKDSKGGVCGHCRLQLIWNGLVDARPVRRRLRMLSADNVGYKTVAAACDVSRTVLAQIMNGTKTRVRKSTADKVLAVDRDAIAETARWSPPGPLGGPSTICSPRPASPGRRSPAASATRTPRCSSARTTCWRRPRPRCCGSTA